MAKGLARVRALRRARRAALKRQDRESKKAWAAQEAQRVAVLAAAVVAPRPVVVVARHRSKAEREWLAGAPRRMAEAAAKKAAEEAAAKKAAKKAAEARLEECKKEELKRLTIAEERRAWRERHSECEENPCKICRAAERATAEEQAKSLDYNTSWWLAQQGYNAKTGAVQPPPVPRLPRVVAAMSNVHPVVRRAGAVVPLKMAEPAPVARCTVGARWGGPANVDPELVERMMKVMGLK